MELGMIGLGRMGGNMTRRLLRGGHRVVVFAPDLEGIQAYVEDSGEGRWAVEESVELAVPVPVIAMALQARFRSRQDQPFGARLLAAMRNRFGGHAVRSAG